MCFRNVDDKEPPGRVGTYHLARELSENRTDQSTQAKVMGEIPEMMLTPATEVRRIPIGCGLKAVLKKTNCTRKVVSFISGQLRHQDDKIVDLARTPLTRSLEGEFSHEERIDQTCNNPA